ncbi:hypothetical protein ADK38_05450 [Streptomyces varsoviensis]|uniref:Uncharacterized protein n=1 Tax=Streptomyces varsoviensis TaxID=67373 RepID=A0ABR5JC47_9ACTN|nr:hypothetical protein ADK38_05450 [Streptomyces varsoviensis]
MPSWPDVALDPPLPGSPFPEFSFPDSPFFASDFEPVSEPVSESDFGPDFGSDFESVVRSRSDGLWDGSAECEGVGDWEEDPEGGACVLPGSTPGAALPRVRPELTAHPDQVLVP